MLRQTYDKATVDALTHVLNELKEYGLEIEINFLTLEILVVDLNSKWEELGCLFCFGWSVGVAMPRTRLRLGRGI